MNVLEQSHIFSKIFAEDDLNNDFDAKDWIIKDNEPRALNDAFLP